MTLKLMKEKLKENYLMELSAWNGKMHKINYRARSEKYRLEQTIYVSTVFQMLSGQALQLLQQSWNFGKLLTDSFGNKAQKKKQTQKS